MIKRIFFSTSFCFFLFIALSQEINIYEKSNIEFELLPVKKMIINSGPVEIDSFINLIGDRHEFVGVNILGRGWYFTEYAAELRKVFAGSSQKVYTSIFETRIYSKDLAMIFWVGDRKVTLRDSSVMEQKSLMRQFMLRRIEGKWKFTFITESIGEPWGSWPPVIKE